MFTHTEATGRTMLIAEMSDGHLLNTIKLLLRRVKECSAYIDALENGEQPKVTALHRAAYGDLYNPNNKERAKQLLNSSLSGLPKYVMEGCLRGLNFVSDLQETFGRKTAYAPVMPTLFLNSKNVPTFDDAVNATPGNRWFAENRKRTVDLHEDEVLAKEGW